MEHEERQARLRFLCNVSPHLKLLTFLQTTALQRKLSFGALDFSPLRHSPALAAREYYTKTAYNGAVEFWQNLDRGETAAIKWRQIIQGWISDS